MGVYFNTLSHLTKFDENQLFDEPDVIVLLTAEPKVVLSIPTQDQ